MPFVFLFDLNTHIQLPRKTTCRLPNELVHIWDVNFNHINYIKLYADKFPILSEIWEEKREVILYLILIHIQQLHR